MFAAEPPVIVQPDQSDTQPDVIEILGTRPDQTQKIDRRSYRVRQTPHSQQKDAAQLLRGLPAVTVTPDDDVNLLGSSNVKIFVDGRPYLSDPKQFLRTLHGSDIERIEIITNPSAQFSAEGTAGIINFVLRTKQEEGSSGAATTEVSSLGHANSDASLKYKHGKWTYELEAHAGIGANARSTYHKRRSVEEAAGSPATVNLENGGGPSRQRYGSGGAKLTYELDSRTSVSAKILGADNRSLAINNVEFLGVTPDFESFSERRRQRENAVFFIGELTFDHKGKKEGESLNASLQLFASPPARTGNLDRFSNGSSLMIQQDGQLVFGNGKIDWQHPMGKSEILSVGGNWDYQELSQHYRFASIGTGGSLGPDSVDQYRAISDTLSAYATFQQPIGSWTVMPGVRVERNTRHISSPGLPDISLDRTDLFPTFHVEHSLSKTLDLTLSYSKRIDRAPTDWLRPYRQVEDVLSIVEGNPRLKDESADSYEINLHYHRKKIDAGVIIYDRETKRLWSSSYSAVDGISVHTFVNSGHGSDRGAEIDLGTPIVKRVKLNASVNLFDQRLPIDSLVGARSYEAFRYTANGTLEWDGPDRGKTPGDVAQLQWIYGSRSRDFQFRDFAWNWLSASYTHSFSKTLSLTGTMTYQGPNRHQLLAPLVQESYAERRPIEFKLRLLKTFGGPNASSPPPAPTAP